MNKRTLIILCIFISFISIGCRDNNVKEEKGEIVDLNIDVVINDKTYNLTLDDNETTREFIKLLPLDIEMDELNGNEKYHYLDITLPTDSYSPHHINKGDLMLYGDDCLVLFYESFDTSYSYTKLGHINDLTDLGSDSVMVKLAKSVHN